MNGDERVLWSMIRLGILDKEGINKPWDASMRSMRHSAIIGDRLWSMIEAEHTRVGESSPTGECGLNLPLSREIASRRTWERLERP